LRTTSYALGTRNNFQGTTTIEEIKRGTEK
jgi:hypothetical protein